jgi:hypothetical protein
MTSTKPSDTPCRGRRRTPPGTIQALVALASLWACTPTFDWRGVPLPDTQLVTELPCRPSRFQRDLALAGVPLKLYMLSCEAGGVTYGVATAEVGDPARVDAVLHALRDSVTATLRSAEPRVAALNLSGTTPFSGNVSVHLHGERPDGQTVEESVRVFARGTRIYQASAIGPVLPEAALKPFEDGLRFALEKPVADPR